MKKILIAVLMLVCLTLSGCRQIDTDSVIETTTAVATESMQTETSITTEVRQASDDLGIFEDDENSKSDEINTSEDEDFWIGKSVFLEDICSEFYSPEDGSYADLYKNPLPEVFENQFSTFNKVFLFLSNDISSYNIEETLCFYQDFNLNYILKSGRSNLALRNPVFFFDRKTGVFYAEGINCDDRSLVKLTISSSEYDNTLSFSDFALLERNIDISNVKNDITILYNSDFRDKGTWVYDFTDKEFAFYLVGEKISSFEIDIDYPYDKFFVPIIDNEKNLLILNMDEPALSLYSPDIRSIKIEENVEKKVFDLKSNSLSIGNHSYLYKKTDGTYFMCEISNMYAFNIFSEDIKCYPVSTDDMIFTLYLDKLGRCYATVTFSINDTVYSSHNNGCYLGYIDEDKRDDPIFHSDFTYTYDEIQEFLPMT